MYPQAAPFAGWQQPPMPAPMGYPMQVPAVQAAASDALQQHLLVLKTSSYPSQREWAANNLATFDWRACPQVVEALVVAAKADPPPSVRAGCAYSLARMGVTAETVLATLRQLKTDQDPRVRQEANQALARLGQGSAPTALPPSGVQPVAAPPRQ